VNRFYYSALRKGEECDGIVRADSLDSAREKLSEEGYEEITLNVLSSVPVDPDLQSPLEDDASRRFQ
jgi:hypothetical protein